MWYWVQMNDDNFKFMRLDKKPSQRWMKVWGVHGPFATDIEALQDALQHKAGAK